MLRLSIIKGLLEIFGLSWILLFIAIGILGGSIQVKINNPLTKELDTITDIAIKHKNK